MNYKKSSLCLWLIFTLLMITFISGSVIAADKVFEGEELSIYPTLSSFEATTGNKISEFNESPMLKEMVESGDLPPIKERLPEEPVVIKPRQEIGKYGGSIKGASEVEGNTGDLFFANMQYLLKLAPDFKTIIPNIAKDWELTDNYTTLKVALRKGMKWSDGHPFTTEDVKFWYNDILLNEELNPVIPDAFKAGGEVVKLEIVDDYTFKLIYAAPVPFILDNLALESAYLGFFIPPKHYMKQFHIEYNDKANELAEEKGYGQWWELFEYNVNGGNGQQNPDLPVLHGWKLDEIDEFGNKYYVRNPYYWKVDTEGNQLPYIDEQMVEMLGDPEVKRMKVVAGELDIAGIWQSLEDYPLYKENEGENYHALLWDDPRPTLDYGFAFNYTHEDEVLREIFRNIKFKQAMSLAIDRDELNEQLFFGQGENRQPAPIPESRFYEPWQPGYFAEYDPEKANELLDEIGLQWDENNQYRLRPDGKKMSITVQFVARMADGVEIVKDHWEEVGIEVHTRQVTGERLATLKEGNKVDVGIWNPHQGTEFAMRAVGATDFVPPFASIGVGYPWYTWYQTDGEDGEEPPSDIKELYETRDKWLLTEIGSKEYIDLGKKLINSYIENLYVIGTVGLLPYPVNISKKLRNIPGDNGLWFPGWLQWQPYPMEQWYFD